MNFIRPMVRWGIIESAALMALVVALSMPSVAAPGDTFPLDKFTDVPALMNAVSSARTAAQTLLAQTTKQSDKAHLEKAVASLDAAIAGGFTVANLEKFINDARQAVDALENVSVGRPIAGNLAEASRAATAKFLENVEKATPRLADTRTREAAAKDLAKAKDDYARGVAAIAAGRRGESLDHFRQAFKRLIDYPLEPAGEVPTRRFRWNYAGMITNPGNIFLEVIDPSDNVTEQIPVPARPLVGVSPDRQYAVVTTWVADGDTSFPRSHDLRHATNGFIRSFAALPFGNVNVTNQGATAIWGVWTISHQDVFDNPVGFQVLNSNGAITETAVYSSPVFPDFVQSNFGEFAFVHSGVNISFFDIDGVPRWNKTLPATGGPAYQFTPDGDLWISYWVGIGLPGPNHLRWWHWDSDLDVVDDRGWTEGPPQE